MDPQPRTLVAVMASGTEQQVHTLYFSDGTVVGYNPERGRILRVQKLPADLGEAEEVVFDTRRRSAAVVMPAPSAPVDRRRSKRD